METYVLYTWADKPVEFKDLEAVLKWVEKNNFFYFVHPPQEYPYPGTHIGQVDIWDCEDCCAADGSGNDHTCAMARPGRAPAVEKGCTLAHIRAEACVKIAASR
jgi:hypothetical protein